VGPGQILAIGRILAIDPAAAGRILAIDPAPAAVQISVNGRAAE
jgi:hypothetical protein